MRYIVDTNVPLVANGAAPQASPACTATCAQRLYDLTRQHTLVIDDGWHIIGEYQHRLRSSGQPGVGDAFLKWVLTNWSNPSRCEMVHITPAADDANGRGFAEFPDDPALAGFDPSDHKFAAVAAAHTKHPPVLNAVDSDWWLYRASLERHHIQVSFLCPDAPYMQKPSKA
jgi:hypothetical protein